MRKATQLLLPTGLPAIERLRGEGIEIENDEHAGCGGYAHRRLRVALLNLMPFKEETETDFVRLLTASSVPVELVLMKLSTHTPKHTSAEHMSRFYLSFDDLKATGIDGLMVTGAPVEQLDFEEVTYWEELKRIFSIYVGLLRQDSISTMAYRNTVFHERSSVYSRKRFSTLRCHCLAG